MFIEIFGNSGLSAVLSDVTFVEPVAKLCAKKNVAPSSCIWKNPMTAICTAPRISISVKPSVKAVSTSADPRRKSAIVILHQQLRRRSILKRLHVGSHVGIRGIRRRAHSVQNRGGRGGDEGERNTVLYKRTGRTIRKQFDQDLHHRETISGVITKTTSV